MRRVEPRRFNPNELDLRIVSIELLEDAKERVGIERITIEIPEEQLETGVLSDLSAVMTASSGNHQVFLHSGRGEWCAMTLKANSLRTKINRALIEEIESHDGCSFRIN
ncbi:hypothetical protein MASR1M31_24730 [Porphyromonadaceae bacterium]